MIKKIHLHNIGPAPDLEAEFGERLNVITGDNGLGKTFLLDACWYALTKRTWADNRPFYPARHVGKADPPRIDYTLIGENGREAQSHAVYDFAAKTEAKKWKGKSGKPSKPGLVIYARIDGGFSVWDPERNYSREEAGPDAETSAHGVLPAFQFRKTEVWNGLPEGARLEDIICNGLVRDVENWSLKKNGTIELLQKVLRTISPDDSDVLTIGESVPVGAVDIPTLVTPYASVPVIHAGAGIQRVLALAYLIVWAWESHKRAAIEAREEPTKRLVLLFDEVEAHLHPKWQRVFLPALIKVVESLLMKDEAKSIQIIATTHAPLVLGSVETLWDDEKDQLFDFDLENGKVELEAIDFAKHGSAENWLGSDSFDLSDDYPGYPLAAQRAMRRADAFMLKHPIPAQTPKEEMDEIHQELLKALGSGDEYWPYWVPYRDQRRGHR
jgi:hypothetical protein